MSAVLTVQVRDEPGYAVVTPTGEIDAYSRPKLSEQLRAAHERGAHSIIVDAGGIDFIDSSGLGALVGAYKRARDRKGHLMIAAAQPHLAKMLRITGLEKVFGICESVAAAVDELHRRAGEGV